MSHPWDWDYLIHRHFSGEELTEEQRTALNERLRKFPRLKKRFAEMAFEQAVLRDALAVSEAIPILIVPKEAEEPVAAPLLKPMPPRPASRRLVLLPVAAAAIFLVALLVWALSEPGASYEVVDGDVKVDGSKVEVSAAAPAHFRMRDGSEVKLAPSTSAVFHGRKDDARQVVEISQGGGTFKVAKAPDAFRVETPAGRILVLGTEFTVDLRKQKRGTPAMAVSVASGKVRVDFGGKTTDLGPGESRVFGEVVEKKDPPVEVVQKDPPVEVRKPPVEKKEPRPVFHGSVRGKVVGKGDAALMLAVESVVSHRRDSSQEVGEGLPGKTLKVQVMRRKDVDLGFDKVQFLYVRKVEIGQEITLDVRQLKGEDFIIGALTEEQHQWATPREERREDPNRKKTREPEKSPDRQDKKED